MTLSVDYLYQFVRVLIKKNQSGALTSTEFAFHWNDQSFSYFDDLVGRFQARNNGKEGINTGLIENETIMTKLTPFTLSIPITITGGKSTKPTDFVYTLALRINDNKVFQIDPDEVWAVKQDVIDPPSVTDNSYYYTEYEDFYSFLPATVTAAELDYLSTPIAIKWGYTFDPQGRQVYNPGTSIQPQWDSHSCREITKRMLTNLGVAYKDPDFANFGKVAQLTGQ